MKIRNVEISEKPAYDLVSLGNKEDIVFFDIETTGFSADSTFVYLIGIIYFENGVYKAMQWLAESRNDERKILITFFEFLKRFKSVVTFNGQGFDIPYLEKRCVRLGLPYDFKGFAGDNNFDIYKKISQLKKPLKLDSLKQKAIESFLGIKRKDKYNGGELISVFFDYEKTGDEKHEDDLILHNFDDIKGMLQVIEILSYADVFSDKVQLISFDIEENPKEETLYKEIAVFKLKLAAAIKSRISISQGNISFTALGDTATLKIKIYNDELKYFYPNYKDYYYLPKEDCAMHKSVAFYVDKDFRTKAKAANCYSKKTGRFLIQKDEVIKPYFKIDYGDKDMYFELTDEFINDNDAKSRYVKHILDIIKK